MKTLQLILTCSLTVSSANANAVIPQLGGRSSVVCKVPRYELPVLFKELSIYKKDISGRARFTFPSGNDLYRIMARLDNEEMPVEEALKKILPQQSSVLCLLMKHDRMQIYFQPPD